MESIGVIFALMLGIVLTVAGSPPMPQGQLPISLPIRPKAKDTCEDAIGRVRRLGEEWEEGDNWCKCIYPESHSFFWDGRNPSDAEKFCQLNGCRAPGNRRLLRNGQRFQNRNGHQCECLRGPNPNLQDASTRFHAKCTYGPGVQDYYYIDWYL